MDGEMKLLEYTDAVLEYLEYLGYPEYIQTYEPKDVATSMAGSCAGGYLAGVSYRKIAIIIFSLTMEKIMSEANSKRLN